MGVPTIDKDQLVMNESEHFFGPSRLGQKIVHLHSLLYILI